MFTALIVFGIMFWLMRTLLCDVSDRPEFDPEYERYERADGARRRRHYEEI
jgi:hypothetical protein